MPARSRLLFHRCLRLRPSAPKMPQEACVAVGDVIEEQTSIAVLRGHGTLLRDGALVASRCGVVRRVNQLILIEPLSGGYTPAVGHVVVGRIVQVRMEAWGRTVGSNRPELSLKGTLRTCCFCLPAACLLFCWCAFALCCPHSFMLTCIVLSAMPQIMAL